MNDDCKVTRSEFKHYPTGVIKMLSEKPIHFNFKRFIAILI